MPVVDAAPDLPTHAGGSHRYVQIAAMLQARIGDGAYPIDGLLPSEPALSAEFGVSRGTIRQAITLLLERGLVKPEVGRGTRIVSLQPRGRLFELGDFDEEIARCGQQPSTHLLERRVIPASQAVAKRLAILPGSEAILLVRLLLADGMPLVHESRYVARATCPELLHEDLERQSVHGLLLHRYGIPLVRVDLSITRRPLTVEIAGALEVPEGTLAFCLDRVTFRAEGQPVTWLTAHYHGDHFDLAVHH